MNNSIHWESLESFLHLIFLLQYGAGIVCLHGYVVMFVSGSLQKKHLLCGIACQHIIAEVFAKNNVPEGVSGLIIGGREVGEWMSNDTRIPLVSATGSTRMGKAVGAAVGARLRKSIVGTGWKQCHHYFKRCRS